MHPDATSTNYNTTENNTENNPLKKRATTVICQPGEFSLTNCRVTPQNNSCYHEVYHKYVYTNVTCAQGKSLQQIV